MRTKAIWNGAVLAESDDTVVVEGNHYSHEPQDLASAGLEVVGVESLLVGGEYPYWGASRRR